MDFVHYTGQAAAMAADLVNTFDAWNRKEHLPDVESLRSFLRDHDMRVPPKITRRDLDDIRALRDRLRGVFESGDEQDAVRAINSLLRDSQATPHITDHDGRPWHLHFAQEDAPLARHVAASAAMGLATVMCDYGIKRFGTCADERCVDVYVDTSRNASRRFCSESCSSRTNVAAYRSRRRPTRV